MRFSHRGVHGELTTLPGCTTVVVSHGVYTTSENRGRGNGAAANEARQQFASAHGYEYMICTVRSDNDVQKRLLTQRGWRKLDDFLSNRDATSIEIWGIEL